MQADTTDAPTVDAHVPELQLIHEDDEVEVTTEDQDPRAQLLQVVRLVEAMTDDHDPTTQLEHTPADALK